MKLSLAPGVYLADIDDDLVFLDARTDAYLCVARRDAPIVRLALMTGDVPGSHDVIAQLLEGDILTTDGPGTPWIQAPETAVADLGHNASDPSIGPLSLALLAWASVRTLIDLRRIPARWFADQRRRAARRPRRRRSAEQLHDEARRFARLRPLVPRSGRCLVRSLLLIHYLNLRGWRVAWVFGVRTHPFQAHCWVEHDGVVLNDSLDHIRWYTPIVRA